MSAQIKHETLLDGEVQIYVREGNKKATYQVRFDNIQDEAKRYVRASLRTSNRSLAIERAIAMYREHHSRAFLGLKSDSVSIEDLMERAIGDLNKDTAKTAKVMHRAYWSEYMNGKDLSRWKTSDIEEYFKWRIQKGIDKTDSNWKPSKDSISLTTLKLERNLLQIFFKAGFHQNLLAKVPVFPSHLENLKGVHKLPAHKRRGRFTDTQYKTVSKDFAFTRKILNNIDLQQFKRPRRPQMGCDQSATIQQGSILVCLYSYRKHRNSTRRSSQVETRGHITQEIQKRRRSLYCD